MKLWFAVFALILSLYLINKKSDRKPWIMETLDEFFIISSIRLDEKCMSSRIGKPSIFTLPIRRYNRYEAHYGHVMICDLFIPLLLVDFHVEYRWAAHGWIVPLPNTNRMFMLRVFLAHINFSFLALPNGGSNVVRCIHHSYECLVKFYEKQ